MEKIITDNLNGTKTATISNKPITQEKTTSQKSPGLFNIYRDINRMCKQIIEPEKLLERICDKIVSYDNFSSVLIASLDQDEEPVFYKKADPDNKLLTVCTLLDNDELPAGYYESVTQLSSHLPSLAHGVSKNDKNQLLLAMQFNDVNYGFILIQIEKSITSEELYLIGDISSEIAFTLHHDILEKERKRNETKVQRDLKEKDVLLAEIHHRVKNNLQIVSGLLYLQSSRTKDESAKNILNESLNRVRSMALIHEQLYQSRDFSRINFKSYIERITRNLTSAYSASSMNVVMDVQMNEVYFSIDTAIPCGLVINELISNSFKYAFPKDFGQKGTITLKLDHKDGYIIIVVKDNGVGLPPDFQIGRTSSCGLEIVKMLAEEQLEGSLFIENKNGAQFTLKFENPGFMF